MLLDPGLTSFAVKNRRDDVDFVLSVFEALLKIRFPINKNRLRIKIDILDVIVHNKRQ